MTVFRNTFCWVAAMCLALALMAPATALSDDDDEGGNGTGGNGSGVYYGDDDDGGNGTGSGVYYGDDDWDDGGNGAGSGVYYGDDDSDDGGNGTFVGSGFSEEDGWDDDESWGGNGTGNGSNGTGAGGGGGNGTGIEIDLDDDDWVDRPLPNQAIVQLSRGVDPNAFASEHSATVLRVLIFPNIALLGLDPQSDDDVELQSLLDDSEVLWAEQNFTNQAPEARPRYFFTSSEGPPRIVDAPALPAGLEFTPASACSTGASVIVAVLDTGVDISHPALAANIVSNGVNMLDVTYDVRDDGNNRDDDNDGQIDEMVGHGTHVAGAILQVAPNAMILPVKVLSSDGTGDSFSVMAGIVYAVEQGAQVINMSLGSTHNSRAIEGAVDFAVNRDVIVVAAAGNGDREEPVEYPAAFSGVISVASTTVDADKAEYSNYHGTVDISAPGNNLASAFPEGLYTTASGTSMSVPLVSGAVALVLEQQPDMLPENVEALLKTSSGPLNLTNPAMTGKLGAGELDIDSSLSCSL